MHLGLLEGGDIKKFSRDLVKVGVVATSDLGARHAGSSEELLVVLSTSWVAVAVAKPTLVGQPGP